MAWSAKMKEMWTNIQIQRGRRAKRWDLNPTKLRAYRKRQREVEKHKETKAKEAYKEMIANKE